MQVAVMGPLEVRTDDLVPVPVAEAEERLLLAALTVGAPRPVDAERLVRIVWDGQPPPDAQQALHALVVRLRAVLEPRLPPDASGRFVLRRARGYLLALPRVEIDALRFTDLADRGRSRLADGDAGEAERLLSAALRLWRGEPYADWPGAEFAEDERRRLTAVQREAQAALAEARSRLATAPATPRPAAFPVPAVPPSSAAPVVVARRPPRLPPRPRTRLADDAPRKPAGAPEPAWAPEPGTGSRRFLLVTAVLVTTMLAAVLAIRTQQTAEVPAAASEVAHPRQDAERLADLSTTHGPLDISLLLAVQAFRMEESAGTRNALRAALMAHPRADRVVRIPGTPQAVTLSGASTLVVVTYLDVVTWRIDRPSPPRALMPIPRDWGFWSAVIPSPRDDVVVAAGRSDDLPWIRMVSTVDGGSRLLLVGERAGGAPVGGVMTPDGHRIVLLVAEPVGRAPEITARWKVVELDVGDGSVRETGILGTFPAPTGALGVDFADDAGSFVLWDRSSDAATLVDLGGGGQTPIQARPNRNGTLGWRALPGGAARLGADGEITLVGRDGATVQVLREHGSSVMDVAVSPDGAWAASGGDGMPDGELYRWDVDPVTGRWTSPEPLTGHSGAVLDVEVDGSGERLVTTSGDTTAISWQMGADARTAEDARSQGSAELLATACAIANRDFTRVEWERYLPDRSFAPTCTDLS